MLVCSFHIKSNRSKIKMNGDDVFVPPSLKWDLGVDEPKGGAPPPLLTRSQLPSMVHLALLMCMHGFPADPSSSPPTTYRMDQPPLPSNKPTRMVLHSAAANLLYQYASRDLSQIPSGTYELVELIRTAPADPPAEFLLSLFRQAHALFQDANQNPLAVISINAALRSSLIDAILMRVLETRPHTSSSGPSGLAALEYFVVHMAGDMGLEDEAVGRVNEYFYAHFPQRTDDLVALMAFWLSLPRNYYQAQCGGDGSSDPAPVARGRTGNAYDDQQDEEEGYLQRYVDEYGWTDIHAALHTRLQKALPMLIGVWTCVSASDRSRLAYVRADGLAVSKSVARRAARGPVWALTVAHRLVDLCKRPVRAAHDDAYVPMLSNSGNGARAGTVLRNVRVRSPTVPRPARGPARADTYPPRDPRKIETTVLAAAEEAKRAAAAAAATKKAADEQRLLRSGSKTMRRSGSSKSAKSDDAETEAGLAERAEMARRQRMRDGRQEINRRRRASVMDAYDVAAAAGNMVGTEGLRRGSLAAGRGSIDSGSSSAGGRTGGRPSIVVQSIGEEEQAVESEADMAMRLDGDAAAAVRALMIAITAGQPYTSSLRRLVDAQSAADAPAHITVQEATALALAIHGRIKLALDRPSAILPASLDPTDDPADDEAVRAAGDGGQATIVDWSDDVVDQYIAGNLAAIGQLITHMRLVSQRQVVRRGSVLSNHTSGGTGGKAGSSARRGSSVSGGAAAQGAARKSLAPGGTDALHAAAASANAAAATGSVRRVSLSPAMALATTSTPGTKRPAQQQKQQQVVPEGLRDIITPSLPRLYRLPGPGLIEEDPTLTVDNLVHHAALKQHLLNDGYADTLLRVLVRSHAVRALYHAAAAVQVYSVDANAARILLRAALPISASASSTMPSNAGDIRRSGMAGSEMIEGISTDDLYSEPAVGKGKSARTSGSRSRTPSPTRRRAGTSVLEVTPPVPAMVVVVAPSDGIDGSRRRTSSLSPGSPPTRNGSISGARKMSSVSTNRSPAESGVLRPPTLMVVDETPEPQTPVQLPLAERPESAAILAPLHVLRHCRHLGLQRHARASFWSLCRHGSQETARAAAMLVQDALWERLGGSLR
ncbi:hypothetical protein BC828DRAFT_386560 [Blastocladiella britannica]|nr:hypothetical protein BC828DRAFT_386560 [Blastocladiella britannica]